MKKLWRRIFPRRSWYVLAREGGGWTVLSVHRTRLDAYLALPVGSGAEYWVARSRDTDLVGAYWQGVTHDDN